MKIACKAASLAGTRGAGVRLTGVSGDKREPGAEKGLDKRKGIVLFTMTFLREAGRAVSMSAVAHT